MARYVNIIILYNGIFESAKKPQRHMYAAQKTNVFFWEGI